MTFYGKWTNYRPTVTTSQTTTKHHHAPEHVLEWADLTVIRSGKRRLHLKLHRPEFLYIKTSVRIYIASYNGALVLYVLYEYVKRASTKLLIICTFLPDKIVLVLYLFQNTGQAPPIYPGDSALFDLHTSLLAFSMGDSSGLVLRLVALGDEHSS